MRNITLSADEQLIEQARLLAKSRHKTLNAMFREWREQFTAQSGGAQEFDALMKRLKHVQAGSRFSRDELNEREVLSRYKHLCVFLRRASAKESSASDDAEHKGNR